MAPLDILNPAGATVATPELSTQHYNEEWKPIPVTHDAKAKIAAIAKAAATISAPRASAPAFAPAVSASTVPKPIAVGTTSRQKKDKFAFGSFGGSVGSLSLGSPHDLKSMYNVSLPRRSDTCRESRSRKPQRVRKSTVDSTLSNSQASGSSNRAGTGILTESDENGHNLSMSPVSFTTASGDSQSTFGASVGSP